MKCDHYFHHCSKEYIETIDNSLFGEVVYVISKMPKRQNEEGVWFMPPKNRKDGQEENEEKTLTEIGSRWPEWDRPYLVHGLVLERAGKRDEARRKLRTAQALGSRDPSVGCALARLAAAPAPDAQCACLAGLRQLVIPGCDKP